MADVVLNAISREKYDDLANLGDNWNGYGEKPTTPEALKVLQAIAVVPTGSGGFQLEWSTLNHEVEIVVNAGGEVTSVYWERAGR